VDCGVAIQRWIVRQAQTWSLETRYWGYAPSCFHCRRTLWAMAWPSRAGVSAEHRRGYWRHGIGVTRPLASTQGITVGDAMTIESRRSRVRPCVIFGGYDVRAQGGYRGVGVVIGGWGLGGEQQTTCGLRQMMSWGMHQSTAFNGNITIEQIHELFCYSDKCVIF